MYNRSYSYRFQQYGEERHKRSAEDIAFNAALFIARNGSFVNYYMYYGGTNYGRSASAYVTSSYYDEAPLDEYGLIRQPKWGHLKELHAVIKESSDTLLVGRYTNFSHGQLQEAHVFQTETGNCVAFLVNSDLRHKATVQFRSLTYELPSMSISILQDCKHVSFNTANASLNMDDPQYQEKRMGPRQPFESVLYDYYVLKFMRYLMEDPLKSLKLKMKELKYRTYGNDDMHVVHFEFLDSIQQYIVE